VHIVRALFFPAEEGALQVQAQHARSGAGQGRGRAPRGRGVHQRRAGSVQALPQALHPWVTCYR
jgi:hypothetical protein